MKCPDCGSNLSELSTTAGMVKRCFRCGGFWLDSWTANRITNRELAKWRRISVSLNWILGGKGLCPADNTMLTRYNGESVPPNIIVSRCVRCGKWWFPGESIFAYKQASEAKIEYYQHWGLTADLASLALPIAVLVLLITGTAVGVNLIRTGQKEKITASEEIKNLSVTYQGAGQALVVFRSTRQIVDQIEYKSVTDLRWQKVKTEYKDGMFLAVLKELIPDTVYSVRIGDIKYEFETK